MTGLFWVMIVAAIMDSVLLGYKYFKNRDLSAISRFISRIAFVLIGILGITQTIFETEFLLQIGISIIFLSSIVSSIAYFIGTNYRDNIEIKRLNKTLEQLQHKYKLALDSAPIGFYVLDGKGKVEYANSRACDLLGYREDEILGKSVFKVVADYDISKVAQNIKNRISGKVPTATYTVDLLRKDGTTIKTRIFSNQTENGHTTVTGSLIPEDQLGCDEENIWMSPL